MTPESLNDLKGLTKHVRLEIDVSAEVRRLERELPSAEELDRWFETPLARAA
jgi:hypothetical protein